MAENNRKSFSCYCIPRLERRSLETLLLPLFYCRYRVHSEYLGCHTYLLLLAISWILPDPPFLLKIRPLGYPSWCSRLVSGAYLAP